MQCRTGASVRKWITVAMVCAFTKNQCAFSFICPLRIELTGVAIRFVSAYWQRNTEFVQSLIHSHILRPYRVADNPPFAPIFCYSYCLCVFVVTLIIVVLQTAGLSLGLFHVYIRPIIMSNTMPHFLTMLPWNASPQTKSFAK